MESRTGILSSLNATLLIAGFAELKFVFMMKGFGAKGGNKGVIINEGSTGQSN
jgi:hypothetical protein